MGGGGDEFGDIGPDYTQALQKFDVSSYDGRASKQRVLKPGQRFAWRRVTIYELVHRGKFFTFADSESGVVSGHGGARPTIWIDRNKRLIQKRIDGKYGYMSREDINGLFTADRWALHYALTGDTAGSKRIIDYDRNLAYHDASLSIAPWNVA